MGIIRIESMSFYAYHGCFAEESAIGTNFLVDLEFEYDSNKAQNTDSINDTIDYLAVYQVVKEQMDIASHLIENVAHRIMNAVCEKFEVKNCKVKVSKLNPPLGGQMYAVSFCCQSCGDRISLSKAPTS
ncbi:MAG: dihydroneopterin aldolase [Bacteroidales bacterium]|jgi:dihydroneopterin aldolase|nr:dihydroneopterin aldolase [Bacteroidales bacterium]